MSELSDKIAAQDKLDQEFKDILEPAEPKSQIDKYTPLKGFPTSILLYAFIDDQLNSGAMAPHDWQVWASDFLCQDGKFTKGTPLKFLLNACNGSGKDAFVVTTFAVWHCITKIRSRCIITSSSNDQLQTQTEAYIRNFCNKINEFYEEKIFIIKQRHIVCKWTGSEIKLFATDEAGRAEGFHPFPDYQQGELCIIVNEGKNIAQGIYEATQRCTYNRYIIVSSPGQTSGFMFDRYCGSVQYPTAYIAGRWYSRKIAYTDCPHIPETRAQSDADDWGGRDKELFRSRYLAEFTSADQCVVITNETLDLCIKAKAPRINIGRGLRGGLDLAAGGDENALYVFNENEYVGKETFTCGEPSVTVLRLIEIFLKFGFTKEEAYRIMGDHGGMGAVYASWFRDKGWELSWCTNQHAPNNKALYGNKVCENWFNFAKMVQRGLIAGLPSDDVKLMRQLANRYYKSQERTGKMILQSKQEARAEGKPSPDRADAVVLAFVDVSYTDFKGYQNKNLGITKRPATLMQSGPLIIASKANETTSAKLAQIEDLYESMAEQKEVKKQSHPLTRGVMQAYRRLLGN